MNVFELANQNFTLSRDQKTLKINIPGIVLVMFKMDGCQGCAATEPIFRQLSMDTSKVNTYATINITRNRDVAKMAMNTSTPIPHVPMFILYVNNEPKAIHKGKRELQAIRDSIYGALSKIQTTQGFMPPPQQNQGPPQGSQEQRSMYGQGRFAPPQLAPQPNYYQPEIPQSSQRPQSQYANLNDVDEEDEERLLTPVQVTPHNVPWESSYKKMGTLD